MRKFFVFAFMVCFLYMLPQAHAEWWNEQDVQRHGDWESRVLLLQSGEAIIHMSTWDMGEQSSLSIGFVPGGKYVIGIFVRPPQMRRAVYNRLIGTIVPCTMRVDRVLNVRFWCEADQNGVIFSLPKEFCDTVLALLQESNQESVLSVEMGGEDPIIYEFSLNGFSYALERCSSWAQSFNR